MAVPPSPAPSSSCDDHDAHRDTTDLVRGALTSLVGKLALASRALAILLMTNLFGPAVFGLYDTAWKAIWIAYKIARFGLHQSLIRAIAACRAAHDPEGENRSIGAGLGLGLLTGATIAGATFVLAPRIAAFYDQPELAFPLRLMAWSLPFMVLAGVLIAATRALRIVKYSVYVNSIGGPLILLVATALAGWGGWGLTGLSAAPLAMGTGTLILALFYFGLHFRMRDCLRSLVHIPTWLRLSRFSFPMMLSDLINSLVMSIDQLMLLKYAPPESVGVYAAARQVSIFMRKAPQAFDSILGPIVADLAHQRRTRDLADELAFVLRWILTINMAYVATIYLAGDRLMQIFGPEFAAGATAAWILCLGMLAFGVSMPLEILLVMAGHPYVNLVNNSLWLASMFLLNLWLIPAHGVLGAAWGATSSLFLVTALRLVQSYRFLRINPLHWKLLKPIAAAGAGALASRLFDHLVPLSPLWSLLPELLLFLTTFLLTLYLLGFDTRDRMLVDRLRRKLRRKKKAREIPEP